MIRLTWIDCVVVLLVLPAGGFSPLLVTWVSAPPLGSSEILQDHTLSRWVSLELNSLYPCIQIEIGSNNTCNSWLQGAGSGESSEMAAEMIMTYGIYCILCDKVELTQEELDHLTVSTIHDLISCFKNVIFFPPRRTTWALVDQQSIFFF